MEQIRDDIELEAALLKALSIKKNFEHFYDNIDTTKLLNVSQTVLKDYKLYYDKYNEDIDWSVFYNDFSQNWHNKEFNNTDIAYYRDVVFPLIRDSRIENNVYTSLLDREAAQKITSIIERGIDELQIHEVMKDLAASKAVYSKEDDDIFKISSVDLGTIEAGQGVEWFLPSLQRGLGDHMAGQFVLFSADSGAGKSAFCISQAVHTLKQHKDRPILYCTSEDTKEDLVGRVLSNLFHKKMPGGFEDIIKNRDTVYKEFLANFDEDMFLSMQIRGPYDLYKIQQKMDRHNPCLVVIDMIDVLADSLDIKCLTKTYNTIRGMANDGYPILGTTQAGNTSYQDKETGMYVHRKQLSEKDTAGSKGGGKQGAAYCMIMAGIDDDIPGLRYLSTTKKKRGSYVNVTCELKDEYSLYKELVLK